MMSVRIPESCFATLTGSDPMAKDVTTDEPPEPDDSAASAVKAQLDGADRLERLAALSTDLNRPLTIEGVVDAILANATSIEHADFVNVALIDHSTGNLRVHSRGLEPDIDGRWSEIPLRGVPRTPLADCVISGRPVVVSCLEELSELYPEMVVDTARTGLTALVSYPLRDGTGQVIGALGLGWEQRPELAGAAASRLELFCDLCGAGLARATRTEALSDLARELRQNLLPTGLQRPRLQVAVDYLPAVNALGFGGDWYDIVELDDSRVVLVVGDAAGHGVRVCRPDGPGEGDRARTGPRARRSPTFRGWHQGRWSAIGPISWRRWPWSSSTWAHSS